MTVEIEGSNINSFLDLAKEKFGLKIKILDGVKKDTHAKNKTLDEKLKSLKTVHPKAGEELKKVFSLLSKDLNRSDIKTARDEYLIKKYAL